MSNIIITPMEAKSTRQNMLLFLVILLCVVIGGSVVYHQYQKPPVQEAVTSQTLSQWFWAQSDTTNSAIVLGGAVGVAYLSVKIYQVKRGIVSGLATLGVLVAGGAWLREIHMMDSKKSSF